MLVVIALALMATTSWLFTEQKAIYPPKYMEGARLRRTVNVIAAITAILLAVLPIGLNRYVYLLAFALVVLWVITAIWMMGHELMMRHQTRAHPWIKEAALQCTCLFLNLAIGLQYLIRATVGSSTDLRSINATTMIFATTAFVLCAAWRIDDQQTRHDQRTNNSKE